MTSTANVPFDFEPILRELELTLSGKILDSETRSIRSLNSEARLLNDEGVMKCMSIIRAHMNLNVCLSDLEQEFINNKCSVIYEELFKVLLINRKTYDIKSDADVQIICQLVDTAIYSAMMRAKDGLENRRYYSSLSQKIIAATDQSKQQSVSV